MFTYFLLNIDYGFCQLCASIPGGRDESAVEVGGQHVEDDLTSHFTHFKTILT